MRSTFRVRKNYLKRASDLHENRLRSSWKDQGSTWKEQGPTWR